MIRLGRRGFGPILLAVLVLASAPGLRAQEAYLITYGPGQEVWELFGHNAIWISDPAQGIDHSFSFGYFDLDRPGFYRDFARGIMPYYGSANPVDRELQFYRERDRDIRIQELALDREQIIRLYDHLHQSIFPGPQYYDYDYYWNNCSTRLRDLLDEVTGQALSAQWTVMPAERTFRDHTRALTAHRYFMHTGIQTVLGPMVDQQISVWDEAFLPQRLADELAGIELASGPLVIDDRIDYRSSSVGDRFSTLSTWPISLGFGLLGLLLLFGSRRMKRPRLALWVERILIAVVGLAGLILALFWVASGHEATWRNAMLLVLNPLWLLWAVPLGRRLHRGLWWLLAASAAVGTVVLALPIGQYRLDELFWYAPLVAGLLWTSYRSMANS